MNLLFNDLIDVESQVEKRAIVNRLLNKHLMAKTFDALLQMSTTLEKTKTVTKNVIDKLRSK